MNISNLIRIAFHALLRNKLRAFLTMLGIIIGVASVIAMLGIGQGSKMSIQNQISSMGTNMVFVMPGSQQRGGVQFGSAAAQSLQEKDVIAIQNESSSIAAISPEVRSSGQVVFGNMNWPSVLYGGNVDYFSIRKIEVKSGRIFTDKEITSAAKVCLIGHTVIKNLFSEGVDPVGQTIRFKNIPFRVIGVLKERGPNTFGQDQDDMLIAPFTTVQKRVLAVTYYQAIYTSAIDETKTQQAVADIESALRRSHKLKDNAENDFTIRSQEDLINTFSSISNILTILLGAIAGISLLVGGIGIMNIMYVSVKERTREIGLRMSIGGRGIDILMQFLIESIMISVIGGLIGILFGMGASQIIGRVLGWPIVILPTSIVVSFFVCAAIGIFFGWYPARSASNLNPIDALRYE